MVLVGGPRQAGKTTLPQSLLKNPIGYLNWGIAEHRSAILKRQSPATSLWVFDEIHECRQ